MFFPQTNTLAYLSGTTVTNTNKKFYKTEVSDLYYKHFTIVNDDHK